MQSQIWLKSADFVKFYESLIKLIKVLVLIDAFFVAKFSTKTPVLKSSNKSKLTKTGPDLLMYISAYKCLRAQPRVIARSAGDKYDKYTKFWGEKSIGIEIWGVDSIADLV